MIFSFIVCDFLAILPPDWYRRRLGYYRSPVSPASTAALRFKVMDPSISLARSPWLLRCLSQQDAFSNI
jgi:hypothetical protein